MKTICSALLFLVAVCLFTAVVGLVGGQPAQATSAVPVTVTNTPLPVMVSNTSVPVSGSVGVSGNVAITGTPAVDIANTPTVNLASGATVQVNNPSSSPLPVQTIGDSSVTHMGQSASEHVVLDWDNATSSYYRVTPTGQTTTFVTPSGKVLVVTDVDWSVLTSTTSSSIEFKLVGCSGSPEPIYLNSLATVNADGSAGKSEHLTSGIVIDNGLCGFSTNTSAGVRSLILRGYFAPNQ